MFADASSRSIHKSQNLETAQESTHNRWTDKQIVVSSYNGIPHSAIKKKKELLKFAITWINLKNILLNKGSKDITYCMIPCSDFQEQANLINADRNHKSDYFWRGRKRYWLGRSVKEYSGLMEISESR